MAIIRKDILQTSMAILLFGFACKKYNLFEERTNEAYKNSELRAITKKFFYNILLFFQYSSLGKITEISEEDDLKGALENSGFVRWLLNICANFRKRVTNYVNASFITKHRIGFKKELYISPVKTVSIITLAAILSNIFFYALFRNAITNAIELLNWIIKGMLLFVGLVGFFCEIDLRNLIGTSLFLKWINRNKQPELEEK